MIKLYSLESCSHCFLLKRELLRTKIQFEVIDDIETIQKEMLKAETMTVPFVKIGDKYVVEATLKKIKELL